MGGHLGLAVVEPTPRTFFEDLGGLLGSLAGGFGVGRAEQAVPGDVDGAGHGVPKLELHRNSRLAMKGANTRRDKGGPWRGGTPPVERRCG